MRKIILVAAATGALSLAACEQEQAELAETDTAEADAMAGQAPVEQVEENLDRAQSNIDAATDALEEIETAEPTATETPVQ